MQDKIEAIGAGQGGQPLVVPLSLTDASRDKMQGMIDAYLRGDKSRTPGQIVRECIPVDIMETLVPLSAHERKDEAIVYTLANTPVMPREKVVEGAPPDGDMMVERSWKLKRARENYVSVIVEGIFEAMKILPANEPQLLVRYKRDHNWIEGGRPHQHEAPIATLGGLISNGAMTRFIDWQGVMDEVRHSPELGALAIRYQVKNVLSGASETYSIKLSEADGLFKRKVGLNIADPGNAPAFDALLERHSRNVEATPGTIILWRDDGTMLHEAMEKTTRPQDPDLKPGDVVRAAVARVGSMKPMGKPGLLV